VAIEGLRSDSSKWSSVLAWHARNENRRPPFHGRWHIVSMNQWDDEYLNEVQAFIEFELNGAGQFQFGYVSGSMDWRPTTWDGEPVVEWTWEGGDAAGGTPLTDRGWTKLKDDQLHGMFFIHLGDSSGFVAVRAKQSNQAKAPKRPRRK
jgi:hypothetical protein